MGRVNSFFKNKFLFLFFIAILAYCTVRITPIYQQTYPYTFDQGRDFLKIEEIIRYKNLTLLGPTTGVMGVYHGVQWYYFLAIPYLLFNGAPQGFIYFILIITLMAFLGFSIFLYRKFNFLTSLFFILLATISPYLIFMSTFAISSTPEIILILSLFILIYKLLETKKPFYQIMLFLNLGLIFEQELPVGIFLIPSLIIAFIVTKQIKIFKFNFKYLLFSFFAFIIASIPRILFEIKHNFIQTKVAIDYITHPTNSDKNELTFFFLKRINTLWDFYKSLFISNSQFIAIIVFIVFVISLRFLYKRLDKIKKTYLNLSIVTIVSIFVFTLLYKKEFSTTYLEGLPIIFLVVLSIIFYELTKITKKSIKPLPYAIVAVLFLLSFISVYSALSEKKDITKGISRQIQVLEYIYEQNQDKNFCLKIYTPPVIPYTYNYLISYNSRVEGYIEPSNNFANNQCWFVIEKEQEGKEFQDRITKWRTENIPKKAKQITKQTMQDGTLIELWKN